MTQTSTLGETASASHRAEFDTRYESHLKHLRLKGMQPKTIEAYAHGVRRLGERFDWRIASLLTLLVFKAAPPALPTPRAQPMRCSCCGAPMRIIARRVPPRHDALGDPPTTCTTATAPPGPTRRHLGAQA